MDDLISRQAAIDALWKALYEYEDKTEKQFQESEDLDVGVWIGHRIFVQNMNDIDRKTILNLPSAQPEQKKGKWKEDGTYWDGIDECNVWKCLNCTAKSYKKSPYCPNCGAKMEG